MTTQTKSDRLAQAEHEVQNLETNLSSLQQRYGDTWPDVITNKNLLEGAKKHRDEILKEEADAKKDAPASGGLNPQTQRQIRSLQDDVSRLESAIAAKKLEIEDNAKNRKATQDSLAAVQGRVESIPHGSAAV